MKLYIDFSEFHPWRGAVNTWEKIKEAGKIDMLEQVLTESYTDGMSNTELNDLLWFESEDLFSLLEIDEADDENDDDFDSILYFIFCIWIFQFHLCVFYDYLATNNQQ